MDMDDETENYGTFNNSYDIRNQLDDLNTIIEHDQMNSYNGLLTSNS